MDEWGVDVARLRLAEGLHAAGRPRRHRASARRRSKAGETAKLHRAATSTSRTCRRRTRPATSPYTPALPMLYGLREVARRCCSRKASRTSSRVIITSPRACAPRSQAWGLKLCAKEPKWYSDTVTAILVPEGYRRRQGHRASPTRATTSRSAPASSKVAGKVFRIGHLGDLNELMLLGAHRRRRDGDARRRHSGHGRQRRRGGPASSRPSDLAGLTSASATRARPSPKNFAKQSAAEWAATLGEEQHVAQNRSRS